MIATVTANPSLDRTLHVNELVPGAVHRAWRETLEPSGKGVNVAPALHGTRHQVTAVLPVGGDSGRQLVSMLDGIGLSHLDVPIDGTLRTNVSIVEANGTTTKINEAGPTLTRDETRLLLDAALGVGDVGDWLVWCGSLPGGFGPPLLAESVAKARKEGRRVAVDTSGAALSTVLSQSSDELPHLIKPNAEELAELTGRTLQTIGDVASAAADLVRRGLDTVLVSLGGDGALLVDRQVTLHGRAPVDRVVNTVGAGDAFLAGYLAADGGGPQERLASGLRYGAAAVQHEGTLLTDIDLECSVQVHPINGSDPLSAPVRK
jgi:1-phosphofructokinase